MNRDQIHQYFDESYFVDSPHGGYQSYEDDARFKYLAQDIIRDTNPTSVLDFGCAKGYLVGRLRNEHNVEAYGVDISQWAIDQANEDVKPFVYALDWKTQPFDIKVDTIVSNDTLEHIPESDLPELKEWFLKHGKKFWFRIGTINTPNYHKDPTHVTIKPLSFWQEWMPQAIWVESVT